MLKIFSAISCVSPSYEHNKSRVSSLITSLEVAFVIFYRTFQGWRGGILEMGFWVLFFEIFDIFGAFNVEQRQCQHARTQLIFYTNDVQYRTLKLASLNSYDAPC